MKYLEIPTPFLVYYIYPVIQNDSYPNTEEKKNKTNQS